MRHVTSLIVIACLLCQASCVEVGYEERVGENVLYRSCDDNLWGDKREPKDVIRFDQVSDGCVTYDARLAWFENDAHVWLQSRVCNTCEQGRVFARKVEKLLPKDVRGDKILYYMRSDMSLRAGEDVLYATHIGCHLLAAGPQPDAESLSRRQERRTIDEVDFLLKSGHSVVHSRTLRPDISVRYNDGRRYDGTSDDFRRCDTNEGARCPSALVRPVHRIELHWPRPIERGDAIENMLYPGQGTLCTLDYMERETTLTNPQILHQILELDPPLSELVPPPPPY